MPNPRTKFECERPWWHHSKGLADADHFSDLLNFSNNRYVLVEAKAKQNKIRIETHYWGRKLDRQEEKRTNRWINEKGKDDWVKGREIQERDSKTMWKKARDRPMENEHFSDVIMASCTFPKTRLCSMAAALEGQTGKPTDHIYLLIKFITWYQRVSFEEKSIISQLWPLPFNITNIFNYYYYH